MAPFVEAGGLAHPPPPGVIAAPTRAAPAAAPAAGSFKGGVFRKGAKAIGVKSVAEREGNLKIR